VANIEPRAVLPGTCSCPLTLFCGEADPLPKAGRLKARALHRQTKLERKPIRTNGSRFDARFGGALLQDEATLIGGKGGLKYACPGGQDG
jgi:hypothetical protein